MCKAPEEKADRDAFIARVNAGVKEGLNGQDPPSPEEAYARVRRYLDSTRSTTSLISRSWREISYSRSSPKGDRGFESNSHILKTLGKPPFF
jgi:hypothetical protein